VAESDNRDVEDPLGPTAEEWDELLGDAARRSEQALRRRDAADEWFGDPGLVDHDDG
jgi:hypothetical protein